MKKLAELFFLFSVCLLVASCSKKATIYGTTDKKQDISLYAFHRGNVDFLQTMQLDSVTQTFQLSLELPYEGLYLLGSDIQTLHPVYLKGGENLCLEFEKNRISLVGEASEENEFLFHWEKQVEEVKIHSFLYNFLYREYSVGYKEFFKELENAAVVRDELLKKLENKDGEFYSLLKNKIKADLDFYALSYLKNSNHQIPDSVSLSEYYQHLYLDTEFDELDILELPYAGKMLEAYVWYKNKDKGIASDRMIESALGILKKKDIQQEYLLSVASQFKFYDEYQSLLEQVESDFFEGNYFSRLKAIEDKLSWSAPGLKAPDFKAMRPDSTWISLSDYKGKVVVVDVWATWCEPCKRMMPLFHKLEQELSNKNIAFINVCVGTWVESDLWKKMAKEFQVENNTSFVNGWKSDFVKDYRISGVPRYMIFDEEGRIVSVKAPNPLKPELKELILKTLKKE